MPPLTKLADEALAPDLRPALGGPAESVVRIFGHHPDLWRSWWVFYGDVMKDGAVSMKLKEIVRLRIAGLNGCNV